jgi:hypothetical protein
MTRNQLVTWFQLATFWSTISKWSNLSGVWAVYSERSGNTFGSERVCDRL